MAGVENLNGLPKLLIDPILKLAEYIKGCPFLITIVIVLFGILFIVVVITLTGKSDIVLLICLLMFCILAMFFGHLESKEKSDVHADDKKGIRRV